MLYSCLEVHSLTSIITIVELLWSGIMLVGEAITLFIREFLKALGLPVADWMIQIAVIVLLLLVIRKYGKHGPKLLLVVLLFIMASIIVEAVFG